MITPEALASERVMPLATAEDRPVLDQIPVLCIGQLNAAAPINCRAGSPMCRKSHLRPGKLATVAAAVSLQYRAM